MGQRRRRRENLFRLSPRRSTYYCMCRSPPSFCPHTGKSVPWCIARAMKKIAFQRHAALLPHVRSLARFLFLLRYCRTGHVCGTEYAVAWPGVHRRLGVAGHWGTRGGGKRHPRGQHDGLASRAAEDAAEHRLWWRRCRRRWLLTVAATTALSLAFLVLIFGSARSYGGTNIFENI